MFFCIIFPLLISAFQMIFLYVQSGHLWFFEIMTFGSRIAVVIFFVNSTTACNNLILIVKLYLLS